MIKGFLSRASLNAKMLFAALLALLLAVGVFFAAYGIGSYFIEKVYMSSEAVSARKAQIYTDFNIYVRQNNLSGTDSAAIARWTAEHEDVTIIVTGGGGNYSVRRGQEAPVNNQISDLIQIAEIYGKLYPMRFADGEYQIAIGDSSQTREQSLFLIGSLVLASVAFIAVMFFYIRRVTDRIIDLSEEAVVIGKGDLEAPITASGGDEISVLATEMDNMRRSVIERMSNEKRAWEANSELITAISHDIRTPMTSLIGYLGLLTEGVNEDEESRARFASAAYGKALELKDLTDELFKYFLVFGRAELEMQRERYDARLLVEQLVGEAAFDLRDAGFEVVQTDFSGECTVVADAMYLKRVMDNLVSNAKKYADRAFPIVFVSELSGNDLSICVSNTIAKGISRVESTRIGLRTCAKIMQAMGGSFETASDEERYAASLSLPADRNE
ncbi:MAG: HAMP domain-containing histidine kinase [Oscillospiraceae bacterium]|nr:HAMP domain-containing histidine kinase [Oscillospiraceae bacterium]